MTAYLNPEYRHDFVLLFDVTYGNPNGDRDSIKRDYSFITIVYFD